MQSAEQYKYNERYMLKTSKMAFSDLSILVDESFPFICSVILSIVLVEDPKAT